MEDEATTVAAAAAAAEGEEAEGEQDLTVYDFEDNEDNEAPVESEAEDDKTKIIKFLPKKSQTVTQAHMCNYCNYTSPKRYYFLHNYLFILFFILVHITLLDLIIFNLFLLLYLKKC